MISLISAILLISELCLADPRFGSLILTSTPESVSVSLDFDERGRTPLLLDGIAPGRHVLTVTKAGYRYQSQSFEIDDGGTDLRLHAVLASDTAKEEPCPRSDLLSGMPLGGTSVPGIFVPIMTHPEIVKNTPPSYPETEFCLPEGTVGEVYVQMLVDTTGGVIRADVAKSSGNAALDQAATKAALEWKFKPALTDQGKPVRVWVMQKFTFKLH